MVATTANFALRYAQGTDAPDLPTISGNLANDVDAALTTDAANVTAITRIKNIAVFAGIGTATLGSTSATYVDVTNAFVTWTKGGSAAASNVLVLLSVSSWASVANTVPVWGVNIGVTDYDVTSTVITTASTHLAMVGFKVITGVAAGAYSPRVRFKRSSGTGTVTIDALDSVHLLVAELPI